jgi:DNA repair and recombination protein RAD52
MYRSSVNNQRQKIQTPSGEPTVGYSPKELENIKIALNRKLGPEFISKRKGPGYNSVQYLEGWKAINLANDIFGPNGWSTELKEFKVDYIDDNKHGSICLGLSCIVRVILKDGTFHEDVGYGSIENCKSKAMAFDKCKKEAFTDGMKRALRQFGNALGNCLYDKEFLQQITKVTSEPVEFDANALMRRSTTMPKLNSHLNSALNDDQSPNINTVLNSNSTKEIGKTLQNLNEPKFNENRNLQDSHNFTSKINPTDKKIREKEIMLKNKGNPREYHDKVKEEIDDSFMFSDDWPDDEEMKNNILNANNYRKDNLPNSDFEREIEAEEEIEVEVEVENFHEEIQDESTGLENNLAKENSIDISIPANVTFVSATSADTIQQDPTLQNSLKYDISVTSTQLNKSSFINHNKSLPVKKLQVKSFAKKDDNKMKMTKKPIINSINNNNAATNNILINSDNAETSSTLPSLDVNKNSIGNPMIKRSFGLPPNKLLNKRLKK